MIIQDIDKGRPFDWGKTSDDYAKYRDIYPQEFYEYILQLRFMFPRKIVLTWTNVRKYIRFKKY